MKRTEPHITKLMQMGLIKAGYKLPKYGADGRWGNETQVAYDKFVSKNAPATPAVNEATTSSNCVIDLSHHQNSVKFKSVAADGITGVIHKATQSTKYLDPTYKSRKTQALDAGLLWGAYHFGTGRNGEDQADHFLNSVKPDKNDLLVLDFEGNPQGSDMTIDQAEEFVQCIYEETGRWPGLYSGHTIKEALGSTTDTILANCWFWLAQYGKFAKVPPAWPTWTMWQYTDGSIGPEPNKVKGVGHCDRDRFNGTINQLKSFWKNG